MVLRLICSVDGGGLLCGIRECEFQVEWPHDLPIGVSRWWGRTHVQPLEKSLALWLADTARSRWSGNCDVGEAGLHCFHSVAGTIEDPCLPVAVLHGVLRYLHPCATVPKSPLLLIH